VSIWKGLLAVTASMVVFVACAHAAGSVSVRDEGKLRFVSSYGSWLTDEGLLAGTIPGKARVSFEYNGSPLVRARFTIHGRAGSISGVAHGRLSSPTSLTPSFRGSLSITGGSGRYRGARGSGELFGVFHRRGYSLVVQAIGTLRYARAIHSARAVNMVHVVRASRAVRAAGFQSATISAVFTPLRLGAHTTATLGFQLRASGGGLPSPLTGIDFRYPRDLGIATSGLGLAACDPVRLEARGPTVCPPNSIMGRGSAEVEVPLGPEVQRESASLVLVAGPSRGGFLNLLVCATGTSPVAARIVMPTLLENGHLHIDVPTIPSLPEGPDVSVVRVRVTLGGSLTYFRRAGGRRVAYRPQGIVLPPRCPRGGFLFGGSFSFLDGSLVSASTRVRCPRGG
jgi:hypothetical protein